VLIADFDLRALREAVAGERTIRDLPRFPAVVEDLSIIVPETMRAAEVIQAIHRAGGALLYAVRLFDVYRGEQVGTGKKSLAFSLTYQAEDRTLTDKDVEKVRAQIIRALEGQLGAIVRR
jgi:phenylalanyl-tRNA synthetase beta chain